MTDTGMENERRKIADAIRTFCKSLSSEAVQMSHGVERIYYSGISLDALSAAAALALPVPVAGPPALPRVLASSSVTHADRAAHVVFAEPLTNEHHAEIIRCLATETVSDQGSGEKGACPDCGSTSDAHHIRCRAPLKSAAQRMRESSPALPEKAVAWRPGDLRVQIACKIEGHIYTDPAAEVGPATQAHRARGLRIADEIIALIGTRPDNSAVVKALDCQEFMPLALKPLENPNHDPGVHQVLDAETAYVFQLHCSRDRAERIIAALNAGAALAHRSGT